jgi:hypothetical protein
VKNLFNILLLSFVLNFFFSETLILCAKSCKSNFTQLVDMSETADDSADNEEQKEDSGKEQTMLSDFSFDILALRSFMQAKYRVLKTPQLNAIFQEVAGQPPQA